MSIVAVKVLSTVNAPYGTTLSAEQLAAKISDPTSAVSFDPSAFSFFSEVNESLQISFLDEMHVDPMAASDLARKFSALAGYPLTSVPRELLRYSAHGSVNDPETRLAGTGTALKGRIFSAY
nr:hypothetical protein [Sinorhizobium meliloti]